MDHIFMQMLHSHTSSDIHNNKSNDDHGNSNSSSFVFSSSNNPTLTSTILEGPNNRCLLLLQLPVVMPSPSLSMTTQQDNSIPAYVASTMHILV